MKTALLITCALALPLAAWQPQLNLSQLDHLASRSSDTVNVTLDASLLKMAAGFISSDDEDAADVKRLVGKLKGIFVRSYGFKNTGEYSRDDLEAIRAQLKEPAWKRIVEVRSRADGDSDVWVKTEAGHIVGLTLLAAQPKQLTVVNIDGAIEVEDLHKLGGNFGIPNSVRDLPGKDEKGGRKDKNKEDN